MNTVQIIAVAVAFVSIVAAIIAGAWINQRGLERLMEAFRNEMRAEFATVRAEIATSRAELKGEIGMLRAEQTATREKVERIERQIEAIFKPVLPGKGD
jgi:hypothetical protein